jgi:ABC-2 type transport system ATP-binding protein
MLNIRELSLTYSGGVQALKSLSLDVPSGVFGLLGPNGAGKTTLMKVLATLLEPQSGTAKFNDIDVIQEKDRLRRVLGYLPQDFGFYPTLTAQQTLHYFAKLKGVSDKQERRRLVDALLDRVNLTSVRKQKLDGFSGGMRQRLGIAQALIGQPKLLIVDEPTSGLDPEERLRCHQLLTEAANDGAVVLLSTHIVSDVSSLCSNLAIIAKGKILTATTPGKATEQLRGSLWQATIPVDQVAAVKSRNRVVRSHVADGMAHVKVLSTNSRPDEGFSPVPATLEDYYLHVVNQPN